jgi:hypothetical protein
MALKKTNNRNEYAELPIIRLTKGKATILDPADYMKLKCFRWFAKKSRSCWYAVRRVRRNNKDTIIRMHRQITSCPAGLFVHHINGNTLDNRRSNLLICTRREHDRLQQTI